MNWHSLDKEKVFEVLDTSVNGLSSDEASIRLAKYGFNRLEEKKKKPAWVIFLAQFKDFMIIILAVAAIVSGIIGDITDTAIILVIVVLNAVIGFVQEYRAERAMELLTKLAVPHVSVVRNGEVVNIDSTLLVPGDLVLLEAGVIVPADLRLMETHLLQIDEAMLTGESFPAVKNSRALHEDHDSLGDRLNMAFKGTLVAKGRGNGIVVGTAMETEIGHIARLLHEEKNVTPLQRRMNEFGKNLSYIILVICLILFGVGLLRGEKPLPMLLIAISLAVAAIPEALPALITIALARGAKQLARNNALIRKLPAVEALGSVTFICTDKTGTLTQNKMSVMKVIPYPVSLELSKRFSLLEIAMALNHDVRKSHDDTLLGDPTELALVEHLHHEHGKDIVDEMQNKFSRIFELPFDSDRKRMTTVHRLDDGLIAFTKGAAESITAILKDSDQNGKIIEDTNKLTTKGIRVLAYAFRVLKSGPGTSLDEQTESDMKFLGLVGMADPPRDEINEAIQNCRTAGITPVMITGDHKETAVAIAKKIQLLGLNDLVMTGKELSMLSQNDLDEKVERIKVYARVSPEQKLGIVKSLQRKRNLVAMTGDGINDAPSLKAADIGIAMGITGTDVSKEAAHMILLDDNFATIVKAVKEGRRIYDNIRKFVKYIMTCNGAEIWTIFLAPLLGLPIPLLPIHILWINLVTDGLPGLSLTTEKAEKNIMNRAPRSRDESLFAEGIGYHIVWVGLLMAFLTLGLQAWAIHTGDTHWQTMVFTVLSFAQLGHVLAIRSGYDFIYQIGIFSNKPLAATLIFTFLLQMAVIYLPVANDLFKTQPLSLRDLFICIIVSAVVFHAVEVEKWIRRLRSRKL
jgi:P-type Ca2+ transporter type 2C